MNDLNPRQLTDIFVAFFVIVLAISALIMWSESRNHK
jgi:hypothetical protein